MSDDIGRTIPARRGDPATSHRATAGARPNQRTLLLRAFAVLQDATDEEAMQAAEGVSPDSEYAKRCSELRDGGFIEPTGEERRGASGNLRLVSRITEQGRSAVSAGTVLVRPSVTAEPPLDTRRIATLRRLIGQAEERGLDSLPLDLLRKIAGVRG